MPEPPDKQRLPSQPAGAESPSTASAIGLAQSSRPSMVLAINLLLKGDLLRVAEAFNQRQIPWLVFKGIPLAQKVYGGIAHRRMCDNDIVVPPRFVRQAHQVLLGLGFYDRPHNTLELCLAADYQHPMHYAHVGGVVTSLELHWHVYAAELFTGGVEPFFQRAVTFVLDDTRCLTLGPEDTLIQVATHWAQHGLNKPTILRDLALLWNHQHTPGNTLDLELLVERSKAIGVWSLLCLGLLLLEADGRCQVNVPVTLRSRRAEWIMRVADKRLRRAMTEEREEQDARELRALSWLLLDPDRMLASVRRELVPSHARLERIVGHRLSRREARARFWRRQLGALGRRRSDAG